MIGRWSKSSDEEVVEGPKGFDDFDLRLGDVMRGERATMGKSLLDVQRELRIKASYIAAIENCDPDAFETPGFIAGYVRSYARYLDMDPDATFAQFCAESGFSTASGMDEGAKSAGRAKPEHAPKAVGLRAAERDPFVNPALPFRPKDESIFAGLEPGAIGSMTVLVALVAALGYGGWSVLQEIQRVQLAPVEQTPVVLSELDPLQAATAQPATPQTSPVQTQVAQGLNPVSPAAPSTGAGVFTPPSSEALDRLYRPQALDVPVLIARDAPISSLDPSQFGAFAEASPTINEDAEAAVAAATLAAQPSPLLVGEGVQIVAVRPAWVRVSDGASVLFTGILNAGDVYPVPQNTADPQIEVGESGAIFYAVNGKTFGPTGPRGTVTSELSLDPFVLAAALPEADLQSDSDLSRVMAELGAPTGDVNPVPQVVETINNRVTVVAARTAWVRVRSAQGNVLYEGVMDAGDFYTVPATEEAPTIRTGDAGAIYFAAAGQTYGPYGNSGAVADNLALSVDTIQSDFTVADIQTNAPLARAVAELNAALPTLSDN
ncbi:helix-turn-helix domain-containing protein [Roseobacteraceae bacterium S113]